MTTHDPRSGPIVVGIDGSEESDAGLVWAVDEARRRGADLRVVHAWRYPTWLLGRGTQVPPGAPEQMEASAHGLIDQALDRVDTTGVDVTKVVVQADPSVALVDEAGRAALVVVGRRGIGGVRRMLLGSVSAAVLHDAPCPVVVLPHEVDG